MAHNPEVKDIGGKQIMEGDVLLPVYGGKEKRVIWQPEKSRYAMVNEDDKDLMFVEKEQLTESKAEKFRIKNTENNGSSLRN